LLLILNCTLLKDLIFLLNQLHVIIDDMHAISILWSHGAHKETASLWKELEYEPPILYVNSLRLCVRLSV
jgi:hypothetical protein